MEENKNKFRLAVLMLTHIFILIMYWVSYSKKSPLFWGFFIIERCMAFSYAEEIDNYLSKLSPEEIGSFDTVVSIIFVVLGLGIFVVTPFKYPKLFLILVLGELIDYVVDKVRTLITNK